MKVSENIKRVREAKGIKQADVAKAIGMERTNYHRIEHRGNKLTIEQMEAIAGALGVSVVELLTGDEQKSWKDAMIEELKKEITQFQKINEDTSLRIETYLDNLLRKQAINSRIGILLLYTNGGETTEIVALSEIPNERDVNNWLETNYPNSYHAEDVVLTEDQERELISKIIKRQKGLLDVLIVVSKFIWHESWREAIKERVERNKLLE